MNAEIEAFRAELKAAGEPWQSLGIKVCAAGFVALVAGQLSAHLLDRLMLVIAIFILAVVLVSIGWCCLIVAFVRRRRWARDQAGLESPPEPL